MARMECLPPHLRSLNLFERKTFWYIFVTRSVESSVRVPNIVNSIFAIQLRGFNAFNPNGLNLMETVSTPLLRDSSFHEESPFEDKSNKCCHIAYFPLSDMTICGHWRVSLCVPISVSLLTFGIHGVFIYDTYDKFPSLWLMCLCYAVSSLSLLSLCVSYFSTICIGPGYLPYNWGETRHKRYDWTYMMSHIVQFRKQFLWAKEHGERPPRSVFSSSALRIVLRADHFCVWARSWIGIKNHRYFILTCVWMCIYSACNLSFRYFYYLSLASEPFPLLAIPGLVSVAVLLYLFVLSFYHMCQALHYTRKNQTLLEVWGDRATNLYDNGCCENYEEICGRRRWCLCWINPCCRLTPAKDGFYEYLSLCEGDPSSLAQLSEPMSSKAWVISEVPMFDAVNKVWTLFTSLSDNSGSCWQNVRKWMESGTTIGIRTVLRGCGDLMEASLPKWQACYSMFLQDGVGFSENVEDAVWRQVYYGMFVTQFDTTSVRGSR